MKLTKPEHIGALQLIPGVGQTDGCDVCLQSCLPHLRCGSLHRPSGHAERVSCREFRLRLLAPELQTAVQFLLGAAADDFHTHGSPRAALFRNVRIGHVVGSDGTRRYVLCGLCSPAGKADWTPFATIKTSGYEQWIGVQAGAVLPEPTGCVG